MLELLTLKKLLLIFFLILIISPGFKIKISKNILIETLKQIKSEQIDLTHSIFIKINSSTVHSKKNTLSIAISHVQNLHKNRPALNFMGDK